MSSLGDWRSVRVALAISAALSAAGLCGASAPPASGQPKRSWAEEKCVRYGKGWSEALKRFGKAGLGPDFLARHEAFIVSGCSGPHDVCARSPEELKMANTMVIVAMNAGTASTFPPFGCPK